MRDIRRWIGGLLVSALVYFFARNVFLNVPTDVSSKFASMESDMDQMLQSGGTVVFKNDLNRASAAFVMRDVSAESWGDDLFTKYRSALTERGWKAINSHGDEWQACRSGMLATIATKQGFFPARGIYTYSMRFEYNAGTIRQCRNAYQ